MVVLGEISHDDNPDIYPGVTPCSDIFGTVGVRGNQEEINPRSNHDHHHHNGQ